MTFWNPLQALFVRSASRNQLSNSRPSRSRRKAQPRRKFEALESRALLTSVAGDFNHDGFVDLAISMPNDAVGGVNGAGSVQVIYGFYDSGLSVGKQQVQTWNKNSTGILGDAQENDHFGAALTVGDFNRDGTVDLAIGTPGEMVGGVAAGAVHILLGSKTGLTSKGNQAWTLAKLNGTPRVGDQFGSALAATDFNRDGYTDLAVGTPGAMVNSISSAGEVSIIFGARGGLTAKNNQLWHEAKSGMLGGIAAGDRFGSSLAAGDFNADGRKDLAIGVPGKIVGGNNGAGAVNVMYGTLTGLKTTNDQFWTADTTDVQGSSNANAQFGFALAAGDFNDDSRMDLAIGAPGENIPAVGSANAVNNAGAVHVLFGSSSRLTATNNQLWHENVAGASGLANSGNRFGAALATGNLSNDRFSDLAIGIPGEKVLDSSPQLQSAAGAVTVLYGSSANGLVATGSQFLNQAINGVSGEPSSNDQFGASLAIGDFDHDGHGDLVAEMPGEISVGSSRGGLVAFFGGSSKLTIDSESELWHRNSTGTLNSGDAFLKVNGKISGIFIQPSGLQVLPFNFGGGAQPGPNSNVTVNYLGKLIDGTTFDSGNGVSFNVNGVIQGFGEALQLMHEGDYFRIFIPSELAYGEAGQGNIGPNEVLVFDLQLVSVNS